MPALMVTCPNTARIVSTGIEIEAEDLRVLSLDKTSDGVAVKFSEKARISPEKLTGFIGAAEGRVFTPTGVLKLKLSEVEQDNLLDTVRQVLYELQE